jgi:hypothetical protein
LKDVPSGLGQVELLLQLLQLLLRLLVLLHLGEHLLLLLLLLLHELPPTLVTARDLL